MPSRLARLDTNSTTYIIHFTSHPTSASSRRRTCSMVPHCQVFLSRLVSLVRPSLSLPPSVFVANGSKSWQLWQDQGQLVLALDSLLFPSTLFPSIRPLRVHLCICLKANLTIEKKGVSLVFFLLLAYQIR